MSCVYCRFWLWDSQGSDYREPPYTPSEASLSTMAGECRHSPPVIAYADGNRAMVSRAWPIVAGGDWCGQYRSVNEDC